MRLITSLMFIGLFLSREAHSGDTPLSTPQASDPAKIQSPLEPVVSQEIKRWSVVLDFWNTGQVHGINRATDRAGLAKEGAEGSEAITDKIDARVAYLINDTTSLGGGIEGTHTYGSVKGNDNGQFTLLDAYLQIANSKLAKVGPVKFKGYLRPYLPTSEAAQNPESGRYGILRAAMTAGMPIGKGFDLSYTVEPRYFFQKNRSYKTFRPNGKLDKWKANENYRVRHWLALGYENGRFGAYQRLGLRSQMYHQDYDSSNGKSLNAAQKDQLYSESGLEYQYTENLEFKVGLFTDSNDFRNNDGWQWYNDKEYLYFVEAIVTF